MNSSSDFGFQVDSLENIKAGSNPHLAVIVASLLVLRIYPLPVGFDYEDEPQAQYFGGVFTSAFEKACQKDDLILSTLNLARVGGGDGAVLPEGMVGWASELRIQFCGFELPRAAIQGGRLMAPDHALVAVKIVAPAALVNKPIIHLPRVVAVAQEYYRSGEVGNPIKPRNRNQKLPYAAETGNLQMAFRKYCGKCRQPHAAADCLRNKHMTFGVFASQRGQKVKSTTSATGSMTAAPNAWRELGSSSVMAPPATPRGREMSRETATSRSRSHSRREEGELEG
mmetsp:Transcript_74654/g.124536  ORF Transcript_74654/g.124536 Transcript_74654/m.124536 type:complete len:283 (-) Transcript_74654:33-881(-)